MPLTHQDIVHKEFREALRGYNQADVDLFLDEIVEEFSRLTEENQKIKVRLAAVQQELARLREGRDPMPEVQVDDPERSEQELRRRLRGYFEEQIRLLDASAPAVSATVERMRREVPPPPVDPPAPPPQVDRPVSREPFWAGE